MFFWTRSLLCIGTIVALASGRAPDAVGPAASTLAGSGTSGVLGAAAMRVCETAPERCLALVKQGAETVAWRDATLRMLRGQAFARTAETARPNGRRVPTAPAL